MSSEPELDLLIKYCLKYYHRHVSIHMHTNIHVCDPTVMRQFSMFLIILVFFFSSENVEVDALTHEGTTPLQLACCQGTRHTVVVKLLIKAGADPNMMKGDDWVLPLPKGTKQHVFNIFS